MNEKEESKRELEQELEWVKYRKKMLDIIEERLLQMKQLTEKVKQGNLTVEELEELNARLDSLAAQVRALDSESRKTEDKIILG